jgi:ribosomal protein S12 methylthiotransferase
MKNRFYMLSLGCPKNEVDSEGMSTLLVEAGWQEVANPKHADVLIVNTCGFIETAREESFGALGELAAQKLPGQHLLAAGCLVQRYGEIIRQTVPGVDGFLGTREWANIVPCLQGLVEPRSDELVRPTDEASVVSPVHRHSRGASAYVKIADGCSAPCAFCAIPLIKGPQRSKPETAIVGEVRQLLAQGVQEIILIAQDTTAYGRDLEREDALPMLLQSIVQTAPHLPWLRLMYAYPQHITPRLIDTMAEHTQICHYLDVPLQHAHPDVLRRMKRSPDIERVRHVVAALRHAMPDVALRTTFIVGYPGETEDEFVTLLDLLEEMRFDRVGIFVFSPEEGTAACSLPNPVPRQVAEERFARAMEVQRQISLHRNQAQVGRTLDVLIEGMDQQLSIGRCYRDAPEIDGYVLLEGEWPVGQMVQARIERALEYDLQGRVRAGGQ